MKIGDKKILKKIIKKKKTANLVEIIDGEIGETARIEEVEIVFQRKLGIAR